VSALCLPAIGSLTGIFAHRTNWAAFVPRELLWAALNWTPLPVWWWLILIAVTLSSIWLKDKANESVPPIVRSFVLLVVCWLGTPIAIAWLATWTEIARLFYPRYLVIVLPAAMLLAGICVNAAARPWQRLAIGLLTFGVAVWSVGLLQRLQQEGRAITPRGEDWRGCVAWLNDQIQTIHYPVLVWSGLIEADALRAPHDELLQEYCVLPVMSLYSLNIEPSDIFPLPTKQPGRLDQVAEMLTVHRGGAWLVVRGNQQSSRRIADQIVAHLEKSDVPEMGAKWHVQEPRSFGRVQVLLIKSDAMPQNESPEGTSAVP
jgi:hypothetical protein